MKEEWGTGEGCWTGDRRGGCASVFKGFHSPPTTSQMTITVTWEGAFPICSFSEWKDAKHVWDRLSFFAFQADSVGCST